MKINTVKLINEVQLRPVLWNKNCKLYKNKGVRQAAWQEVYKELTPNYDCLDKEEQKAIREYILMILNVYLDY